MADRDSSDTVTRACSFTATVAGYTNGMRSASPSWAALRPGIAAAAAAAEVMTVTSADGQIPCRLTDRPVGFSAEGTWPAGGGAGEGTWPAGGGSGLFSRTVALQRRPELCRTAGRRPAVTGGLQTLCLPLSVPRRTPGSQLPVTSYRLSWTPSYRLRRHVPEGGEDTGTAGRRVSSPLPPSYLPCPSYLPIRHSVFPPLAPVVTPPPLLTPVFPHSCAPVPRPPPRRASPCTR